MNTSETAQPACIEPYSTHQREIEQTRKENKSCSPAFTIGAFVAGIGVGIYLATSRREELAALADNIHSSYNNAKDEASKVGTYVKNKTPKLKLW